MTDDQPTLGAPDTTGVRPLHTQMRVADAYASAYQGKLIHVTALGWLHWTGTHWSMRDGEKAAARAIDKTVRLMAYHGVGDPTMEAAVKACSTDNAQKGVLRMASARLEFTRDIELMDADPFLFNMPNGTLDLRTNEIRPHDKDDLITKISKAEYSDTGREQWDAFLEVIIPDPEVRAYLQRVAGIGLLGEVKEHILAILHGEEGMNGKSTFYEALLYAFGDYGHKAESDLLMKSKSNPNAASPSQAALFGKRILVCSETEEDAAFAAALMKSLTGGDTIRARNLHRDPFEFVPSHTPFLVTNYLPQIKATDSAAWRRLRVIPFSVRIPEDKRDPDLGSKLKLSASAILHWAHEGWVMYQDSGYQMDEPASVRIATTGYQEQSNVIARFVKDELVLDPTLQISRQEVLAAFTEYCKNEQAPPWKPADLYNYLRKQGCGDKRTNKGRYITGVGIKLTPDQEDSLLAAED